MRGLVWSHLLASVLGALVVAGVLLGFGVIGKQRTETVPINTPTPQAPAGQSPVATADSDIYNNESPGVVQVRATLSSAVHSPFLPGAEVAGAVSSGSGFLISDSGYILTSYHVIEGADADGITVVVNRDVRRRATLEQSSEADDVALLKIDMHGVPSEIQPLTLGSSEQVQPGDATLAMANPFGFNRTMSTGIVSALQGELSGSGGQIAHVIQTDTATSPAASGGPLLNASDGSVIGVSSELEVTSGGRRYMVGFAVPIKTVENEVIPKGVLPG